MGIYPILLAFHFLAYVSRELKIEERQLLAHKLPAKTVNGLSAIFLKKLDFGEQGYLADALAVYFRLLLTRHQTRKTPGRSEVKP